MDGLIGFLWASLDHIDALSKTSVELSPLGAFVKNRKCDKKRLHNFIAGAAARS